MPTSVYVFAYGNETWADAVDKAELVWRIPDELLTSATPLLRGVDAYDDTTFNRRQCGHLLDEVRHLQTRDLGAEHNELLQELARLTEVVVQGGPHRYLRFSGD